MYATATNPNYYISPGALTFQENANNSSEYVVVSSYARTLMRVKPVKIDDVMVIDWAADLEYKNWQLTTKNTKFNDAYATLPLNIYVRLNRYDTSDALVFFSPKTLDILGNEVLEESNEDVDDGASQEEETPQYTPENATMLYIQIGWVTPPAYGVREIHYDSGNLGTAKGDAENGSDALAAMFKTITQGAVKLIQPQLGFVNIVLQDSLQLGQKLITAITDVISTVGENEKTTTLPTVKGVIDYIASVVDGLNNKFLRKDQADATSYKLTMGEAEVTGDASVGGDLGVTGDAAVGDTLSVGDELSVGGDMEVTGGASIGGDFGVTGETELVGKVTVHGAMQSDHFEPGIRGWKLDRNGNLEAETAHFRSAIETDELIINRQQAQEGDTIYSENDQIETVEAVGGSGGTTNYILTLKEKWDGYFTAQQYGNIIRGKINTLAAKEAEVWPEGVDYSTAEYASSQGVDAGGNKYYTSFMHCVATHNTNPALGVNQIEVALYGDEDVPMARNYPPCPLMAIARWGCRDYASPSDPDYETVLASIKRRQSLFMLTTTDGHIVKMTGVNQPILENWNFGTTLGTLPEFVKHWSIGSRLIDGRDYLYAQGVVVGDFIKVDIDGAPILNYVDCGEWVDGSSIAEPSIGNGIYLYAEKNDVSLQWETSDVWWKGCKWRCMQHQPVVSGGTTTYHEPGWNSSYWQFLEGDNQFRMEFASSMGYRFRRGSVNTTFVPTLYVGNEDITDEIATQYWYWTRTSDVTTAESRAADTVWNSNHTRMKTLTITDSDMPAWWATDNRIKFICHVTISDGRTLEFRV